MNPLFGAILLSAEYEPYLSLLSEVLKANGLQSQLVLPKNWKDKGEGIHIFAKFNPELVKELLDWGIEPLLLGDIPENQLSDMIDSGLSLHWKLSIHSLFQLPLYPLPREDLHWAIFTKSRAYDRRLEIILNTFGQSVTSDGDFDHFLLRLRQAPPQIAILDWDQLPMDIKKAVESLKKLKETKQILFFGIKNFQKEHLYRDLRLGITDLSPGLWSREEFLASVVHSFPLKDAQRKAKSPLGQPIKKIEFAFQEQTKPIRYQVLENVLVQVSVEDGRTEMDKRKELFSSILFRSL